MKPDTLLPIVFAALLLAPVLAVGKDHEDPIRKLLYPPELIMEHRDELDLDADQEAAIRDQLKQTQAAVFDLRWQMREESQRLAELLRARPIDETAVLAQAETVMGLEQEIKRTHLAMLVRFKNLMSDQQLDTLRRHR